MLNYEVIKTVKGGYLVKSSDRIKGYDKGYNFKGNFMPDQFEFYKEQLGNVRKIVADKHKNAAKLYDIQEQQLVQYSEREEQVLIGLIAIGEQFLVEDKNLGLRKYKMIDFVPGVMITAKDLDNGQVKRFINRNIQVWPLVLKKNIETGRETNRGLDIS